MAGPRDRVEALSPGLPEIKERSGIWNLVRVPIVVVYYCRTYEKAVSGGGEREKGGHVLRDTTSRGLYVRFWPPHTSERRGGGGGCEQEGWQGGEGRARISRWAGVARAPSLSHTCGHTGMSFIFLEYERLDGHISCHELIHLNLKSFDSDGVC